MQLKTTLISKGMMFIFRLRVAVPLDITKYSDFVAGQVDVDQGTDYNLRP